LPGVFRKSIHTRCCVGWSACRKRLQARDGRRQHRGEQPANRQADCRDQGHSFRRHRCDSTILLLTRHPFVREPSRGASLDTSTPLSVAAARSADASPCGMIQRACGSGHAFAFHAD
jgi:hypothetical protein